MSEQRPTLRTPADPDPRSFSPSPKRWVLVWAALGVLGFAVWAYLWIAWFITGEATPNAFGHDQVPTNVKVWVWIFQTVSIIVAVAAVAYAVRSSRREGRLSFDAILLIAWTAVYWQDPIINYIRPQFFYNTYFLNLGAWAERIPGWVSPNGSKLPEPLMFTGSFYVWFVFTAIAYCAAMRWAKEHWPQRSTAALMAWGFVVLAVFDLVLEYCLIRTRIFAYPGAIHALSLHGGTPNQFPLYEPVFASLLWGTMGALRYFRDDRGRSIVERGIDHVRVSARRKSFIRVLAVTGFLNVAFILLYNLPYQWIGLHIDEVPTYPAYQRAGICGEGSDVACPAPTLPIPLPEAPVPPPDPGS